MKPTSDKRAIVFDIGQVLVDVRFDGLIDFLGSKGLTLADSSALAEALDYELYETGRISDAEFHQRVLKLTQQSFSFADWSKAWTGVLTPVPVMLDLADRLATRYPVYILSNTNNLHLAHMERQLGLRARYNGMLTSIDAGAMKPDARIYAHALREFGAAASDLVFFDDREENVLGAIEAGWSAYRFQDYDTTLAQLKELGFNAGC